MLDQEWFKEVLAEAKRRRNRLGWTIYEEVGTVVINDRVLSKVEILIGSQTGDKTSI